MCVYYVRSTLFLLGLLLYFPYFFFHWLYSILIFLTGIINLSSYGHFLHFVEYNSGVLHVFASSYLILVICPNRTRHVSLFQDLRSLLCCCGHFYGRLRMSFILWCFSLCCLFEIGFCLDYFCVRFYIAQRFVVFTMSFDGLF